jgi:hypothetical protein
VNVHDLFERRYPACRTNHTRAAAKLHLVISVKAGGPRSVKLTSVLDVEVEVPFRRRAHLGRRAAARRRSRPLGARNTDTGRYHLYVTNIPPDRLTAEDVARAHTSRWQIELRFKEMKTCNRLGDLPSRKPHIVEALPYATLTTLAVSRRGPCKACGQMDRDDVPPRADGSQSLPTIAGCRNCEWPDYHTDGASGENSC